MSKIRTIIIHLHEKVKPIVKEKKKKKMNSGLIKDKVEKADTICDKKVMSEIVNCSRIIFDSKD